MAIAVDSAAAIAIAVRAVKVAVAVADSVAAQVVGIEPDTGKIRLSRKPLLPPPTVDDDGKVTIASTDAKSAERAIEIIKGLTASPDVGAGPRPPRREGGGGGGHHEGGGSQGGGEPQV